jgi:hypothetical protein
MATKQRLPRTALLCHEIMLAILPAAKKPSDSGSSVRNLRPLCFSAPLRQIEPPNGLNRVPFSLGIFFRSKGAEWVTGSWRTGS